jgi:hypothetical protein
MAVGPRVAGAQYIAASLWLLAAISPPSLLRVPDSVFEILAPLVFAGLLGLGVGVLLSGRAGSRPAVVLGGTVLCGFLVAVIVALDVLIPTSLSGF